MEAGLTAETAGFDSIDWSVSWLAGLREIASPILRNPDWREALNTAAQAQGLRNHRDLALRFVAQQELPQEMAYEEFIGISGCVPTRDNLHDFFNAIVWLAYPRIKRQLNAMQAAAILAADGVVTRGKLRDAATIFDENSALFACADSALIDALRNHRWAELFIAGRTGFQKSWSVHLFGHALMEKLTQPFKAITAHAWIVEVTPEFFDLAEAQQRDQLDQIVSQQLTYGLSTAQFTPLPVLGVPGWWPQQDEAFYSDQSVFRAKRVARATGGH